MGPHPIPSRRHPPPPHSRTLAERFEELCEVLDAIVRSLWTPDRGSPS